MHQDRVIVTMMIRFDPSCKDHSPVHSMVFSKDNANLITGDEKGDIRMYDVSALAAALTSTSHRGGHKAGKLLLDTEIPLLKKWRAHSAMVVRSVSWHHSYCLPRFKRCIIDVNNIRDNDFIVYNGLVPRTTFCLAVETAGCVLGMSTVAITEPYVSLRIQSGGCPI